MKNVIRGVNDLAATHPELSKEWHPLLNGELKPEQFTAGSGSVINWVCELRHTWPATIASRANGSGCRYCSNQAVLIGFNDLESQNPTVAKEWDLSKNALRPSEVVLRSSKKAWWVCSRGHSYEAVISSRTSQGTGCAYCAGKKILAGFNDLETVSPPYLAEWNYQKNTVKPSEVGPAVRKMAWWTCSIGHDYECTLVGRSQGYGCPYCGSRKILPGFNDFESQYPEVARFWDAEKNGKPASLAPKSSPRPAWFRCDFGHSYRSSTNSIAGRGMGHSGCPTCSGQILLTGFNDLATISPRVTMLWHPEKNKPLTAEDVTGASRKKVWWQCLADSRHEWQSTVANRTSVAARSKEGNGCPVCSSRIVILGVNDLFSIAPQLRAEWHPTKNNELDPKTLTAETPKMVWWQCSIDKRHEWQARVDARTKRGTGCSICGNRITATGLNDLRTTHPHLAAEFNEVRNAISLDSIRAGNPANFWWTCSTCKAEWKAAPVNRSRVNSGCPKCAKSGYDATSDAFLYLLRKENEGLQQFGISNVPKTRTTLHQRNGWEVVDVIGPADGYWIAETETALKSFFRAEGLLLPKDYPDKFDGYTESWDSTQLQFNTVAEMLSALTDFEWSSETL